MTNTSNENGVFHPKKLEPNGNDHHKKVALIGVGLLSLLAVGVFTLLPKSINPPSSSLATHTGSASGVSPSNNKSSMSPASAGYSSASEQAQSAEGLSSAQNEAPSNIPTANDTTWQAAQVNESRKKAQEALNQLLQLDKELKSKKVELWAESEYQLGQSIAEKADSAYTNQDYQNALKLYQDALASFKKTKALADDVANKAFEASVSLVKRRQAAPAETQANIAFAIDPQSQRFQDQLEQASNLKRVLPLIIEAEALEVNNDIQPAISLAQKALDVDSNLELSKQTLNRLKNKLKNQKVNELITTALNLSNNQDFTGALDTISKAKKISPNDSQIKQIENQITSSKKDYSITANNKNAQNAETNEDWKLAVAHYQRILKSYPDLIEYQKKLKTATTNQELYKNLDTIIKEPDAITKSSNRLANARALFETARELSSANRPKLNEKISQLSSILVLASTPKPIHITSDNKTEIVIYRVGKLGALGNQTLALNPGTYTFLGTRQGYRDVRLDITVGVNDSHKEITLICSEKVSSS